MLKKIDDLIIYYEKWGFTWKIEVKISAGHSLSSI
jgi:hypothetical protein